MMSEAYWKSQIESDPRRDMDSVVDPEINSEIAVIAGTVFCGNKPIAGTFEDVTESEVLFHRLGLTKKQNVFDYCFRYRRSQLDIYDGVWDDFAVSLTSDAILSRHSIIAKACIGVV